MGEARRAADAAQRAAQYAASDAAQALHRAGLSTREVGLLMGLSHQRVHQLIEG